MAIVRDIGMTVPALKDTIFVTCSALMTTAASTAATGMLSAETTAGAIVSAGAETTAFGHVIDRLSAPLGARYTVAMPTARLHSSRGSTEADRKITLGLRLLHGDSSGGGDMAALSTDSDPDTRQYFSTARTSEMRNWDGSISTGVLNAVSNPCYYDLRRAKRFVQVAVPVYKNRVTTESSGDEQARVGATLTFLGGDVLPDVGNNPRSPFSSSTST